ncbi:hypothetical protein [Dyadobacter bucti]|uniref:hypothetical protein n=1 Tax=Dyadobacter bucti TaxID=2572203 RepID=UPI003F6E9CEA
MKDYQFKILISIIMPVEMIRTIEQHLLANTFFPPEAEIWKPGNSVYEGVFIQKINARQFIVHAQRHMALDPFQLAENANWVFDSLDGAYKKWSDLENGIYD